MDYKKDYLQCNSSFLRIKFYFRDGHAQTLTFLTVIDYLLYTYEFNMIELK